MTEFRRALEEKHIDPARYRILTEYSLLLDHDGFSITGNIIRGGSQRGLMYGLLEAAAQIRRQGRLSQAKAKPATAMRGIRWFLHNADLERGWYHDREHWRSFFEMLARNRFNRFNLVFAHQTDYLAPPYPYWVRVPEFPGVRVPGLSDADRERNLDTLRFISQTAADYGVDFTLGVWEHDVQKGMKPSVEGLTPANIGPYSRAALKAVLASCPAIRSVQMRTNSESGIPPERQVEFYRDHVFKALAEAGRLVQLDLRGWLMEKGLQEAALGAGVPVRISSKYWAEDLGRPYQPAETWPNYSFLNFLEKPPVTERPRAWQFYWELWGLGSHRLMLWGDPEFVKRAVPTFALSGSLGFEIDPPLAQKGFGNRPGLWSIFADCRPVPWKYEWQRYWLFYLLWGRLSYNPAEPERLWMDEFTSRFGKAAAKDAFTAVAASSRVLNEVVAAHLADPNMYIWPEVNPGGTILSYLDVPPSDFRFIASFREDAANRAAKRPSAKQTPEETATRLESWSGEALSAGARVTAALGAAHLEWAVTRPDTEVLALLARFHALRQRAAARLAWYEATHGEQALKDARPLLESALAVWREIVKKTDGVYPAEMAFGPEDVGHWRDKLPYVEHDLRTIDELLEAREKYGRFERGFDFGGMVQPARMQNYRRLPYVERNTVALGFEAVGPDTLYDEAQGFGWAAAVPRQAHALPLAPYAEVRAVARDPHRLPSNVLLGDWLEGQGPQVFRVRSADGPREVAYLRPDGSQDVRQLAAAGGTLDIPMPEGDWKMCGLLVRDATPAQAPPYRIVVRPERPGLEHTAPKQAPSGAPLLLTLRLWPVTGVTAVRLHYRHLNQLESWKTVEQPPSRLTFTIPASEMDARWDLQYYFEVLHLQGSGWFLPEPVKATPYFVVSVHVPVAETAPAAAAPQAP
jgi:hypothetical protein